MLSVPPWLVIRGFGLGLREGVFRTRVVNGRGVAWLGRREQGGLRTPMKSLRHTTVLGRPGICCAVLLASLAVCPIAQREGLAADAPAEARRTQAGPSNRASGRTAERKPSTRFLTVRVPVTGSRVAQPVGADGKVAATTWSMTVISSREIQGMGATTVGQALSRGMASAGSR